MYYMIVNTADIPELAETTRISVSGLQAVLDDTQFAMLGMDEIDCQMLSQKKALALMETEDWKADETTNEGAC